MREFKTGATRDNDVDKHDPEGFLSPLVMQRYFAYMHKHRLQADGRLRASDNWQKGIPKSAYIKSAFRHFMDWWLEHRGLPSREGLQDALCALMFNVMGYLHEDLMRGDSVESRPEEPTPDPSSEKGRVSLDGNKQVQSSPSQLLEPLELFCEGESITD